MPSKRSVNPELDEILARPENRFCADCGAKAPRWASVNLGVLVCLDCSGAHRNLGTHISFVQSVSLDTKRWQEKWLSACSKIGNRKSNDFYERNLPESFAKPKEGSSGQALYNWIRDKYDLKKYAPRGVLTPAERLAQGLDVSDNPHCADRDRSSSGERRQPRDRSSSKGRRRVQQSQQMANPVGKNTLCSSQQSHQVETLDLLGGFEESNQAPAALAATANWTAFPSDAFALQQLEVSQLQSQLQSPPQQQQQMMNTLEQQLGALTFDSNSTTQLTCAESRQQPCLPTLLTSKSAEDSHAAKVDDMQKSLAALYAQPAGNKYAALGMQISTKEVGGMQQFGGSQHMGMQQFGGMQQVMGAQQFMGMQQFGGMQQMMGNQLNFGMPQLGCGQQFNGMQQVMDNQMTPAMQQPTNGMQHMAIGLASRGF